MTFEMQTDVRARRVAKDLKSIAAEYKIKLRLTESQQAVARLYGYATWNELVGALGTGTGREDHELTAEALEERKRGQISALIAVGIPGSLAEEILERLAPTARTEADLPRVSLIQTHNDYHPMRLMWTLSIDFERDSDSDYDTIQEEYAGWAKKRTLAPLDRAALSNLEGDSLEGMAWSAEKILERTHFVVDAVAIAGEASKRDVMNEVWRPELSNGKDETLYFHFGCHRFPSPFPGLGVEGCYVDTLVAQRSEDAPDQVEFVFVVSPDVASEETGYMMEGDTSPIRLRENIRIVSVYFCPGEGDLVGECLRTTGLGDAKVDAYLGLWRPYLPPLVNAGWNCLKIWKSRKYLQLHDALSIEDDRETVRRFERARTEQKKMAIAAEIAGESSQVLVRLIDREPQPADLVSEVASAPYPRSDSGSPGYDRDYVQSIIEDAFEVSRAWGMFWHATKAEGLAATALAAAGIEDIAGADHPAAAQYLRAASLVMNALWEVEEKERALLQAVMLARKLPVDSIGLFPALARIYVEHGDEMRARAAAAKYAGAKPSDALVAWSVALIDTKFGPPEQARVSLERAHSLNALAPAALLQIDISPWSWFWRGEESPGGDDEAHHIACLHVAAWRTIEGYREILKSIDRFADGSSKHVAMDVYERQVAALRGEHYRRDATLARAEEAFDMAWDETTDPLQKVELARKALAISPLCVGAYIMLASYANLSPDEKLRCWEMGVTAGAKMLGERFFKKEVGLFWDLTESRDYMRARQGLALELWKQGRRADAVAHLKELLRLNPGDAQRNLFILLPWLIQMDRDDEIEGLLKVWSKGYDVSLMNQMTMITWTRALAAYRRDPATASEYLVAAMKCNAFVPSYLFGDRRLEPFSPRYYSHGDASEAGEYARLALPAWKKSKGAISWVDGTLAALAMNPVGNDPSRTHFRH